MAIKLSPETIVNLQLGGIFVAAAALVTGTIFVWTIKTNGEQALTEIKAIREETGPALKKIDRLWWDYETRIASRPSSHQAQP